MGSAPGVKAGNVIGRRYWLLALGIVTLAYVLVFALTRDQSLLNLLRATARNVVSLALAVAAARAALRRWAMPLSGVRLWLAHGALAAAFAYLWWWLLTLAAAILDAGSPNRFTVAPFLLDAAAAWQLLQGAFAYVAIAAITALEHRPAGAVIVIDSQAGGFRDRFLVRADEDVVPLAAGDIVSISGADDYAEIVTPDGKRLVATTLAEFEAVLDPARFLRVHRSAIVNLDHLDRAEPAGGGRMILRMRFGRDVAASRAGARLLRERLL